MTRCLDEGKLQSYFDGELSIAMMESVTSHLASCVTCAAAARELEQETELLNSALAAEFEVNVPTELLRQRIDAAVLGERTVIAQATEKSSGLAAFFSSLFNFGTQRTLGYASLATVVAFAVIAGVVKMKNTSDATVATQNPTTPQTAPASQTPQTGSQQVAQAPTPDTETPLVVRQVSSSSKGTPIRTVKAANSTPRPAPVKLLPGERSYLETIAKLDSTIKSGNTDMRPSLRVEYERNLAVVDRAIAATRSAVKSNPQDPDAADFMFAAYQSKVALLNTIADARVGGGRGH
jgi:hypothetical protein